MRHFITKNGNVLVVDSTRQFFQTPQNEFIRPCSDAELEYLMEQTLIEFAPVANFEPSLKDGENFPQWHYLTTQLVQSDYSNYKRETCLNGGNYAFYTYCHVFFSKKDGVFKFGYIDEITSSADFFITWDGKFQNDNTYIKFSNSETDLKPVYNFQVYDKNGNRQYEIVEPIEKYLQFCNIESIFAMEHLEIPENCSEEDIKYTQIFDEDKKENILFTLKEYGFTELKSKINKNKKR